MYQDLEYCQRRQVLVLLDLFRGSSALHSEEWSGEIKVKWEKREIQILKTDLGKKEEETLG